MKRKKNMQEKGYSFREHKKNSITYSNAKLVWTSAWWDIGELY